MKFKRMLSLFMAVLMVVSTLAGFTISAAADEPDADSAEILHGYIRTGLFAWYSGEQNQREGQNNDASVWHDLVGGHDLTVKTDGNNYFTEEGLHVKTAKHYFDDDIVAVVNADSFTVEIEFGEFSSVGTTFNTFMNSSNDNFALFRRNGTDQIEFKHAGLPGDQRPKTGNALENLNNSLITITFEQGGTVKLFVNGERKKTKDAPNLMGANDLFIGHDDVSKDFEAIFKNIRFYTRALSEAEVLHNAAVDGYADVKNKYVQDGLVSLYSGVSNTEAGYDANASVWADLVGENDLPITSNEMNYFTREGFRVEGDTTIQYFPQPIVDLVNAESFSVEISFGEFREVGSAYGTFLNSTNDNFALFRQVSDNRIAFKFGGNPGNERPYVDDALNMLDNGVISVTYKVGGKCRIYFDGVLSAEVDCNRMMNANNLFIGQRNEVKTFDSTYKSIRFYNRELTAEEVYANATADGVTAIMNAAAENPGYVTVAQPVTNIVGDIAIARAINSQSELEVLVNSKNVAAVGIYEINKDLEVLDAKGQPFSTVTDVLLAADYRILSCFCIKDKETADALAEFMTSIRFSDFQVMSADKEVLKYVRDKINNCYGILDLREAYADTADLSEEQLLDIRRAVKAYNASVAVLPVGLCRNEDVQYLYDRQVNVWAWCSDDPDVTEQYAALLSGAAGVVSDATVKLLDIACNQLEKNTMTRLPINIGHRGIPSKAPENCIEGAMYAYELGAEVIEIDVYLTKDQQAVLMHDGTTGRTCNKDISVEGSTLSELTALYCNKGYENNARFKDAKVPSLDDFMAAFKDTDVRFYIEIKSGAEALVPIVKEIVEKYGMYGQCSVISFSAGVLANFRKHYPEMSVGALCMAYMNGDNPESEFRAAMQFIGKNNATLNPRFTANGSTSAYEYQADDLRAAMLRGIQMHPWTFAGSVSAYEHHFMWGYAGLTGDNADAFKRIVRKVALPEDLTFTAGIATDVTHILTTYERSTSSSGNVAVTVINGDAAVNGNAVTPAAGGELTMITSSTHRIGGSTYTMYTQPVTVTVKEAEVTTQPEITETEAPAPEVTDPAEQTVAEPSVDTEPMSDAATETENETTASETGCQSSVAGMLVSVISVAAALLLRKRRED